MINCRLKIAWYVELLVVLEVSNMYIYNIYIYNLHMYATYIKNWFDGKIRFSTVPIPLGWSEEHLGVDVTSGGRCSWHLDPRAEWCRLEFLFINFYNVSTWWLLWGWCDIVTFSDFFFNYCLGRWRLCIHCRVNTPCISLQESSLGLCNWVCEKIDPADLIHSIQCGYIVERPVYLHWGWIFHGITLCLEYLMFFFGWCCVMYMLNIRSAFGHICMLQCLVVQQNVFRFFLLMFTCWIFIFVHQHIYLNPPVGSDFFSPLY